MPKQWNPDYVARFAWRQKQIRMFEKKPELVAGALEYYRSNPIEFINHWVDTYDPRNAGTSVPTHMPLVMFPRQEELVEFLLACLRGQEDGLIEKARDMGATWVGAAFSVWLWLYWDGASVGWGSRKEQYVDKIGDPDSIFEKLRMIIKRLPKFFLPEGFSPNEHMTFMRIVNPATDATITGEAGNNMGRGGRKLIYFKDESAHYANPEAIEAAIGDNTRVAIDISSVNGLGNIFHSKRESGVEWNGGEASSEGVNIFIMDWRDHPHKTQEWYDKRKAKAKGAGLEHIFAQEVDRDYAASVEGVMIKAEWVISAIDAHIKLGFSDAGRWHGALDIADEGADRNAQALRKGVVLKKIDEWGNRDTGETARHSIKLCEGLGAMNVEYDSIGVGAGVKSEINRIKRDEDKKVNMHKDLKYVPWDASASPLNKDKRMNEGDKESPLIGDYFHNFKAQGWWEFARRFEKTHKMVTGEETYDFDELISIDSTIDNLQTLKKELSQPTSALSSSLKMIVNKKPKGTKSPNLADSVMMCYMPTKVKREQRYGSAGKRTF